LGTWFFGCKLAEIELNEAEAAVEGCLCFFVAISREKSRFSADARRSITLPKLSLLSGCRAASRAPGQKRGKTLWCSLNEFTKAPPPVGRLEGWP
jgi:hypothetical protein